MTFQANVRATFNTRAFSKRASLVALAATFFTSLAVARESDPVIAYLLFFLATILVGVLHTLKTGRDINEHPSLTVRAAVKPILLAFGVGAVAILAVSRFAQWTEGSWTDKLFAAFVAGVLVGFTEEYARWVWLQTLPWSTYTANVFWVILHPAVAVVFTGGIPNVFFAAYALVFGFLMTGVMWYYEVRLPLRTNEFLGPVAAGGLHGVHNVVVTILAVYFGTVQLVAMQFFGVT